MQPEEWVEGRKTEGKGEMWQSSPGENDGQAVIKIFRRSHEENAAVDYIGG